MAFRQPLTPMDLGPAVMDTDRTWKPQRKGPWGSASVSGKPSICPTLWFSEGKVIRLRGRGLAPGPLARQAEGQDQDTRLLAQCSFPVQFSPMVWAIATRDMILESGGMETR